MYSGWETNVQNSASHHSVQPKYSSQNGRVKDTKSKNCVCVDKQTLKQTKIAACEYLLVSQFLHLLLLRVD